MPRPATATFNYKVVRQFAIMTVVWGIVGMLVGVIIAAQLLWPDLNFDIPWLSYGRLRPLHTNAVIFAFGGSALFATSYYVVQRTCQVRLFRRHSASFTFWGWQAVIVLAAVTLPLGFTSGKEYAELEWPIDILITLVWVSYAVVFFGTIVLRKTPHIYVANWFFGAFILTVAVLHLVNSAEMPGLVLADEVVFGLCRRPGRDGPVVVRPQRGGLLPHRGLPRDDVLLRAEAGGPARLFVPAVGRALLGADLHLHVGGPAPPALHGAARLDAVARHGLFADPAGAVVGRHDQRDHDAVRRVAQVARRPDPQVPDRVAVVLRDEHVRGPDDVDQDRQRAVALHRLDDRPRALRRARLGRVHLDRLHVLPHPADVRQGRDVVGQAHHAALLDRDDRRRALHRGDVDRRRHAGADVARGQRRRHAHLRVRRGAEGDVPVLRDPAARRRALPRRHADHGAGTSFARSPAPRRSRRRSRPSRRRTREAAGAQR